MTPRRCGSPTVGLLSRLRPPRPAPAARRGDEGLALPTVLALMVVSVVLVTSVTAVALTTVGSTTSSRAAVQAQAAADAGIDFARAAITAGTYSCEYRSDVAPVYVVSAAFAGVSGAPACTTPVGAPGTSLPAQGALLVSTGTAAIPGIQGQTSGNTRRAQAVLTRTAGSSAGPLSTTAILGAGAVTAQNTLQVLESVSGRGDADVESGTGGFSCTSTSKVQGVVRTLGAVSLVNTCTANAVWASGTVTLNGQAVVKGDIFSASTSTNPAAVNVAGGNPEPQANVYANGPVSLGDANVGGSVLSTRSSVTFKNGSTISGSAYGWAGVDYGDGGNGKIKRDAVAARGTISGPTSQNAGEYKWSIGGNASAAGCIANSVRISGTVTGTVMPRGQSCTATGATARSGPSIPATPNNPAGVPATTMPATVSAPTVQSFPTLASRTTGTTDPLDKWRQAGWSVKVFPVATARTNACTQARDYLKKAVTQGTTEYTEWLASPLLVVIRDCTEPFQFDGDNAALMTNSSMRLFNDLAVMSDYGINNQNAFSYLSSLTNQRSASTAERNVYWLVPSDSPVVTSATTPTCSANKGALAPNNVTIQGNVRWLMYTPCAVSTSNTIGASDTPIVGAVIGGSVSVGSSMYLKYASMSIPGAGGGSSSAGASWAADVRAIATS